MFICSSRFGYYLFVSFLHSYVSSFGGYLYIYNFLASCPELVFLFHFHFSGLGRVTHSFVLFPAAYIPVTYLEIYSWRSLLLLMHIFISPWRPLLLLMY